MNCSYSFVFNRQPSRSREGKGLIELLVCFSDGSKTYLSTQTYVNQKDWDSSTRYIKPSSSEFSYVNKRLANFKTHIQDIETYSENFSPEAIRTHRKSSHTTILRRTDTVNYLMEKYIHRQTRVSDGAILNYRQSLSKLNEFDSEIKLSRLRDDAMGLVRDLDQFLFSSGLAPTTIDKHHSIFRKFFNEIATSLKFGIVDPYTDWEFSGSASPNKVFLSVGDIEKIEQCPADGVEQVVKDAFMLAYYTGVRYSDMIRLVPDNIYTVQGRKVFMFYPTKTTKHNRKPKKAIIPITDNISGILDKYDGVFPVPSGYTIRRHIKSICKRAGINDDFKFTYFQGRDTVEKIVPKYMKITTHTARRSAVNNMRMAGVPVDMIMRITGHKTLSALNAYIGGDDTEDELKSLLDNEYFKK